MTIRLRLALGYAVAIGLTLALAAMLVWIQFGVSLRSALDRTLAVQASAAATAIENQDGQAGLQEGDTGPPAGTWLAVFDATGRLVDASGRDASIVSSMTLPTGVHEVVLAGRTFAVASAPLAGGGDVVAGSPLQPVEGPLANLARLFVVVELVSAAASGGLGWWLAGRALRPVVGLTEATRELDPADLERRLPVPPRVDELGRLAATMNGLLERTSATVRRQRLFVAAASHDLRTPIATLQAELELADDDRSTRDELLAAVRAARADLASLTSLAAGLLELAAAEPGGRPLVRSEVDLEALIASCLRRVAPVARRQSVTVGAAAPHVAIRVDRVRMEQALTNLLMNAVTHGRAGGHVDVLAAVDPGPGRGRVSIEVLDRGPGVPADAVGRVFEPFERNGTGGAVGLGLATAAGAVRAHGGEIGVRPRAGGGSAFWLTVPLEPPS